MTELPNFDHVRPTVHLNGTAQEQLLSDLSEIRHALESAVAKATQAGPHARDYPADYPSYREAVRDWERFCSRLQIWGAALSELQQRIADQEPNRRDRDSEYSLS